MNEFEEYLEKLQNLSHSTKKKILWIGAPIVMIVIVFVWFSYTDFGLSENKNIDIKEGVSKFEVLKNGFAVTFKEAGNLIKDLKEKINQTNSFEVMAPGQGENIGSTTPLQIDQISATSTLTNKDLENKIATTTEIKK